jgi:SAD/SRA domain
MSFEEKSEGALSWRDVLAMHGSRRGIRITPTQATILLDFGLSPYKNDRREAGRLYYQGEGLKGDQVPTKGNAGLLECLETKRPVRVFERTKPGVWFDRGQYFVVDAAYKKLESEKRMVFEFVLEPANAMPPEVHPPFTLKR